MKWLDAKWRDTRHRHRWNYLRDAGDMAVYDCKCRARLLVPREPIEPALKRRPRRGKCPGCGAAEDVWCAESCPRLDPMDVL